MVAGDGLAGRKQSRNLLSQSRRCRIVVVIPVSNDFAQSAAAAKVSLVSDSRSTIELTEPYSLIVRY